MAIENFDLRLDHSTLRDLYVLLKSREDRLTGQLRSILIALQSEIYDHYNIEELEELNRLIEAQ